MVKLVASSVVRSTEQGESRGGVSEALESVGAKVRQQQYRLHLGRGEAEALLDGSAKGAFEFVGVEHW